ncbi:MAG: hypothetical protein HY741_16125 [Chloroflexi bacterium]|nr:hypothetical protein [Chloroflexota bacterium]
MSKEETIQGLIDARGKIMELAHHDLIAFLEKIPARDFEKDFGVRSPRGKVVTISDWLQTEIEDEQTHAEQIRRWVETG